MPIAAAPNRGYADWQRLGNYDSGALWDLTYGPGAAQQQSPIKDVSRYAYLGGWIAIPAGAAQVSYHWFDDALGANVIGQRNYNADHNIIFQQQLRLPNLGPFVQVTLTALGGANYQAVVHLIGTNRVHPLEFVPVESVLVSEPGGSIFGGQTITLYPSDYYAGPVTIDAKIDTQPWQLFLDYLDGNGTYTTAYETAYTDVIDHIFTWTTPSGAWRLRAVNNAGTNGHLWLTAIPSLTGAS